MIETSYFWKNIFFISAGTLFIRSFFMFLSNRIKISDRLKEIFSFIPAAIIPALIAPMVFFHHGSSDLLFGKERFIILILSTFVCYLSKSMFITLAFGLTLLYALTSLF